MIEERDCRKCGVALTEFTWSKAARAWKDYVCHSCYKEYQRQHFHKHRERYCANMRRHSAELRAAVLAAYGGQCACCGEQEAKFLTIDHVNNDGKEHRLATKGNGYAIYRWLRDRGFPKEGFQLLCWNCNHAKYIHGICPHQEATATEQAALN